MTGVPGASAVFLSATAGSSCHSIRTSSAASSASARVRATTIATGSPAQHARSTAIGYCGADFMPGKQVSVPTHGAVQSLASSAPVMTRATPGWRLASLVSIETILAWAKGLRTNAACSMRGSETSSV